MLEVADLAVEIQSSEILRGVSFKIAAGELVCLVGRNGAGKTTTLRTVMGYVAPRERRDPPCRCGPDRKIHP